RGTIERLQRCRQAGRRTATATDVDKRADDAADHLVTERRGGDLETRERAEMRVDDAPFRRREATNETHVRSGPAAERREVVLADQGAGRIVHRVEIESVGYVPGGARDQRVRVGVVPDVVVVAA